MAENLYENSTLLNISFYSDADPKGKFRKIVVNETVNKHGQFDVGAKLECHDYMILKLETSEGFHTKTIDCSEDTHTESFVPKMSSLVSKVKFLTDFDQLATEIVQPIESGEIFNERDYLKHNDVNQAVSSGIAKRGYSEEIMY